MPCRKMDAGVQVRRTCDRDMTSHAHAREQLPHDCRSGTHVRPARHAYPAVRSEKRKASAWSSIQESIFPQMTLFCSLQMLEPPTKNHLQIVSC